MKTNELMIGDWVKFPTSDLCHKVYAVQGKSVKFDNKYWHKADKLEPIPLTEEILEKNCFTRYRENEELWDVGVFRLDLGLFAVGIDNGCGTGMCIMPHGIMTFYCKYVHELQHALRLCGIEKDIIEL